jgi:hypothetical protein
MLQVNTAGRDAAASPGSSDSLAAFAGTYATHLLPAEDGAQVAAGAEVAITVNSQGRISIQNPRLFGVGRLNRNRSAFLWRLGPLLRSQPDRETADYLVVGL